MTDFHTHILPGVDDGSADVPQSLEMLRASGRQGVDCAAATPHFYAEHETPDSFLRRRDAALRALRPAMEAEGGLPRLIAGAEVHYFAGISAFTGLDALKLEGTELVLVEMPMAAWTARMKAELAHLCGNTRLIPVVAHIDRYLAIPGNRRLPEELAGMSVLVQANAGFFLHPRTARAAAGLLGEGLIHLLGSDCHNLTTRPPNLRAAVTAIERRLGAGAAARLARMEEYALSGRGALEGVLL